MPYPVEGFGLALKPDGKLVYGGRDVTSKKPGQPVNVPVIVEADWDGNILWEYRDPQQHHAFAWLDNGNFMVLKHSRVPPQIAAKVKGGLPGTDQEAMLDDSFQEVNRAGEVVWEWLAYQHLDPSIDIICPICTRREWLHTNSCFVMPNGDILTTFHHLDTVAIIDKKSGEIKWRWGAGKIAHPHNPTLLDNGNILFFDNGQHRKATVQSYSRILEVNPKTGNIDWEYMDYPASKFYSTFGSGAQRLPNGNTLITESAKGRIFEVTPEKEKIWEYNSPFFFLDRTPSAMGVCNRVGRACRYAEDYSGFKGRDLNPDNVELALRAAPKRTQPVQERRRPE
jgi:hypothetical protein